MNHFIERPASKIVMRKPVHGVGINDSNYVVMYVDNDGIKKRCPFYLT